MSSPPVSPSARADIGSALHRLVMPPPLLVPLVTALVMPLVPLVLAGSEYQQAVLSGQSFPARNYRLQPAPSASWRLPLAPLHNFTQMTSQCEWGIVLCLRLR